MTGQKINVNTCLLFAFACFGKACKRNIRQPLPEREFMATIQSTIIGQHRCKRTFLHGRGILDKPMKIKTTILSAL